MHNAQDRRKFLKVLSSAGMLSAMPGTMFASSESHILQEVAISSPLSVPPGQSIRFSVCGISHDHIYGMVGAIQRGGGILVSVWGAEPDKLAAFRKRYPDVKVVDTQQAILGDSSIQLILSSQVPNERAPLGVRVMRSGKDYLSDKPGILTLAQLAEVRKTIAETQKIYAIMYSELLEVRAAVKAGQLIQAGAIGRVIQTINIAPHQVQQGLGSGDNGGSGARPDWFWDPERNGGILADIGSHQVDQFLFYTGSTEAEIAESQVANVNHPSRPLFQDFGDMVLRGNRGFGYVRLDWFTPDGLGTWGDGRLFILGTEGYIEVRKYINVAVSKTGNNLILVDQKQSRYFDCNQVELPFGPQFVSDILHRTHTAQDQTQCLLAAELVIKAQAAAKHVTLTA